jgi:hypothetical protein
MTCPQVGQPAASFYAFGHPTPFANGDMCDIATKAEIENTFSRSLQHGVSKGV